MLKKIVLAAILGIASVASVASVASANARGISTTSQSANSNAGSVTPDCPFWEPVCHH